MHIAFQLNFCTVEMHIAFVAKKIIQMIRGPTPVHKQNEKVWIDISGWGVIFWNNEIGFIWESSEIP